jgi:hypothetical protein
MPLRSRRSIAGHPPPLVRVDHQVEAVADRRPHGLDDGEVVAPAIAAKTDLGRTDPALEELDAALDTLLRRHHLSRRGVRAKSLVPPAEELGDRRADQLAERIPDRDLDGPRPRSVEVDRLADLADDVGLADVDADEQALEERPVGQPVTARGDACDAVVGRYEDYGRVLVGSRPGIPRGVKRRLERIAVDPRLDRRDRHQLPA